MRHVQGNDLKLFVSKLQEIEQEIQNRYSQGRRMETIDDNTEKQEPEIESRDIDYPEDFAIANAIYMYILKNFKME